jgi:hypothetical protein
MPLASQRELALEFRFATNVRDQRNYPAFCPRPRKEGGPVADLPFVAAAWQDRYA